MDDMEDRDISYWSSFDQRNIIIILRIEEKKKSDHSRELCSIINKLNSEFYVEMNAPTNNGDHFEMRHHPLLRPFI